MHAFEEEMADSQELDRSRSLERTWLERGQVSDGVCKQAASLGPYPQVCCSNPNAWSFVSLIEGPIRGRPRD